MLIMIRVHALRHAQPLCLLIIQRDYVLISAHQYPIIMVTIEYVIFLVLVLLALVRIYLLRILLENVCNFVLQAVSLIVLIEDAWMFVLVLNMHTIIPVTLRILVWRCALMVFMVLLQLNHV